MANWCTGELKIRGNKEDIKSFIINQCTIINDKGIEEPLKIEKDTETALWLDKEQMIYYVEYTEKNLREEVLKDLYVKNSNRMFLSLAMELIEFCVEDTEGKNIISLGCRQAWDIDIDLLTELSVKYNLDFKIFAFEPGGCFNRDIEIIDGEIITDNVIEYDNYSDYVWNSQCTTIGG